MVYMKLSVLHTFSDIAIHPVGTPVSLPTMSTSILVGVGCPAKKGSCAGKWPHVLQSSGLFYCRSHAIFFSISSFPILICLPLLEDALQCLLPNLILLQSITSETKAVPFTKPLKILLCNWNISPEPLQRITFAFFLTLLQK